MKKLVAILSLISSLAWGQSFAPFQWVSGGGNNLVAQFGTGAGIPSGDTIANYSSLPFTISTLLTLDGGSLTIVSTGTNGPLTTITGGTAGTGDLILNANSAGGITLSSASVNHSGGINNTGTGTGTNTISAIIGTSVTNIVQNSPTSPLSLAGVNTYTGPVILNTGVLQANGSLAALGVGAATLIINGGTLDCNHSATLAFIRPTTINNNATIITEKNVPGAGVVYVLGTLNIGNYTLNVSGGNVTSGADGLTFAATTFSGSPIFVVNNPVGGGVETLLLGAVTSGGYNATFKGNGLITQNGIWSGTGGIILDSTFTGKLTLSQANSFSGGTLIKNGTLSASVAGGFGDTNLSVITVGDSSGTNNATLNGGIAGPFTNAISIASGNTGLATITQTTACNFAGPITLNNHDLNALAGTTYTLTLSGGITGTGNINLNGGGGGSAITLSGPGINNIGTITNLNAGTGVAAISAPIGANVTAITENSPTSQLTLSGANTFTCNPFVKAGTLSGTTASAFGSTNNVVILGDSSGTNNVTLSLGAAAPPLSNSVSVASGNTGIATIVDPGYTWNFLGAVTLNSHDLTLSSTGAGVFTFSGGVTGTGNLAINDASGTMAFSVNSLNNVGTITNSGTGVNTVVINSIIGPNVTGVTQNSVGSYLKLNGVNTYPGPTLATNGVLYVNGVNQGQGSVVAGGAGVLSGTGTIWGAVNINTGGIIAPGLTYATNSAGVLILTNNLTINGGTFNCNVAGTNVATSQYGQIKLTSGNVSLSSALLQVNAISNYSPAANAKLWIVNNTGSGSTSGTFTGLPEGATTNIAATPFTINYGANFGTLATNGGNDILLHN